MQVVIIYKWDMLFNKEELYAISILLKLKRNNINGSLEEFSKEIGISKTHGHKLTRKLKEAGLIDSYQGRNGGYYLSKPLSKISLFDVHIALYGKDRGSYVHPENMNHKNIKMKKQLKNIDKSICLIMKKTKLDKMI